MYQKLHKWKHMYRTGGQMETKNPLIRWRNLQGQKLFGCSITRPYKQPRMLIWQSTKCSYESEMILLKFHVTYLIVVVNKLKSNKVLQRFCEATVEPNLLGISGLWDILWIGLTSCVLTFFSNALSIEISVSG